jgi:hypothetical protein
MKRSFDNATATDSMASASCVESLFDALPEDMYAEITHHLPNGPLLCLAATCKFAFRYVFGFAELRVALPRRWDRKSIVPVAFLGEFPELIANADADDYRRMVAKILYCNPAGEYVNAPKWLPALVKGLVLNRCAPAVDDEHRLVQFMKTHVTTALSDYLFHHYSKATGADDCDSLALVDPLWIAIANFKGDVVEALAEYSRSDDRETHPVFDGLTWGLFTSDDWRGIANAIDEVWTHALKSPMFFLRRLLCFAQSQCPLLPFFSQVFWDVILHESVTFADIDTLVSSVPKNTATIPMRLHYSPKAKYIQEKLFPFIDICHEQH